MSRSHITIASTRAAGSLFSCWSRTNRGKLNQATRKFETIVVPWLEATEYQRELEIERQVSESERRARAGRDFVAFLKEVIEQFHGKPLIEVEREQGPEPIQRGERRILVRQDGTRYALKAADILRGRVFYHHENGRRAWMGMQAWRRLEKE